MIYVVYRALYGEDFIQQSMLSVIDHVDKIFFFWCDKPLGNISSCVYRGEKVDFPKKIDSVYDKVLDLKKQYPDKIVMVYDYVENNDNQFTHLVNDLILPNYEKPDFIFFMEHDHVFKKDQIQKVLDIIFKKKSKVFGTRQIEFWKNFNYVIPERKGRLSCVIWNMRELNKIPRTGKHANVPGIEFIDVFVHNFGFCMSEKNMYWKHLLALGFSQEIKDSNPNELWYDKWLNWDIDSNLNMGLEISKGSEHTIPYAYRYDGELPEVILT